IRDFHVTGVQTCALPIWSRPSPFAPACLRAGANARTFPLAGNCRRPPGKGHERMGAHSQKKLYSTVLIGPEADKRGQRKARRKAAARIHAEDAAARKAEAQARYDAERAERRATIYLPRGGEPGPAALRSYRRF